MVYIGSSLDVPSRLYSHKQALLRERHPNSVLQSDFSEHGETCFHFFQDFELDSAAEIAAKEGEEIDRYKSLGKSYNVNGRRKPVFTPENSISPAELKPIVEAWGGTEKFAKIIDVKERTVMSWLYGERNIKPPIAKLIRSLKPPEPRKENQ